MASTCHMIVVGRGRMLKVRVLFFHGEMLHTQRKEGEHTMNASETPIPLTYQFAQERYDTMLYRRCGRSGLLLPAISLGAHETFGSYRDIEATRACLYHAFNLGITHFDLANNYGRPPGNAETVVGQILQGMPRDELIIFEQSRLPHVARSLWRVALQEGPGGEPGPVTTTPEIRLCRYLLRAPSRSAYALRGDDGCPGPDRTPGESALYRRE